LPLFARSTSPRDWVVVPGADPELVLVVVSIDVVVLEAAASLDPTAAVVTVVAPVEPGDAPAVVPVVAAGGVVAGRSRRGGRRSRAAAVVTERESVVSEAATVVVVVGCCRRRDNRTGSTVEPKDPRAGRRVEARWGRLLAARFLANDQPLPCRLEACGPGADAAVAPRRRECDPIRQ
jgi:hypothetical protein